MMSAEDIGRKLINEVEQERLDEVKISKPFTFASLSHANYI